MNAARAEMLHGLHNQQSPQFAPHWRREFGAAYCVPPLPGWADDSWRNDVCPRFINNTNPNLELWIDHPDPAQRETGTETPRFRRFTAKRANLPRAKCKCSSIRPKRPRNPPPPPRL